MAIVILISCGKSKQNYPCKAKDMYIGVLFRKSLQVAEKIHPNKILILSAKYGAIPLTKEITPYNITLNNFNEKGKKTWARKVIKQLTEAGVKKEDELIFLAGENYRKYLMEIYKNSKCPVAGLTLGKQLSLYNKILSK